MHESIAAWPSQYFYQSKLQTAAHLCNVKVLPEGIRWPASNTPMVFVHHSNSHEVVGTSCRNSYEADLIDGVLKNILAFSSNEASSIAVLTPYASQLTLLCSRLGEYIERGLFVSSIDKAQGSEKPLVLISLVRSSRTSSGIGFLSDPRRLNVAITRAKRGLIVIGDALALMQGETCGCWTSFLQHLRVLGCIVDSGFTPISSFASINAPVLDVSKALLSSESEEKLPFRGLHSSIVLCGDDLNMIVNELIFLASKLLQSKQFLFWLNWILRLPSHFYNTGNQPTNPVEKDQKGWSHLTELRRFGVRRDASNITYFYCVTMLAHFIGNAPCCWNRLSECVLSLPVDETYRSFFLFDFFNFCL